MALAPPVLVSQPPVNSSENNTEGGVVFEGKKTME